VKIGAIRLDRMRLPLDPPFNAAWDPLPRRHFDATLVTVETDEGVTGYGSGDTMDGFEPFEPLFTGRDPPPTSPFLFMANHVRVIESIGFHAGRYWPLEAALWDIIGQVTGQPVSVLFGGAARRLPAYASFGEARPPQARAEAALAAKAVGFRAAKLRIDRTDIGTSLQSVRATRAAVGDDFTLMADLNQWWRMAGDTSPALDQAAVLAVGMLRARSIGELALLRGRWFTPHTWTNGLGLLANLHVVAGVGGGPYVEFPYDPPGWTEARRDFFLAEPIRIDADGCLTVPDAPGLGATINHPAVARYARTA